MILIPYQLVHLSNVMSIEQATMDKYLTPNANVQ